MKSVSIQGPDILPIVAMPPNFDAVSAESLLDHEEGRPQAPSEESPNPRQATEDEELGSDDQEQKYWRDWRRVTEDPPE